MLDRQNGGIIMVECESCDAVLDTETADFEEARGLMRTEGWKVRKIASEWLHGCPRCGVPT